MAPLAMQVSTFIVAVIGLLLIGAGTGMIDIFANKAAMNIVLGVVLMGIGGVGFVRGLQV